MPRRRSAFQPTEQLSNAAPSFQMEVGVRELAQQSEPRQV